MRVRYFPAVVERVSDGFTVYFPDLDGCVSAGDTMEQLAANAEAAVTLHIHGMIEDGQQIPEPTPLEKLEADPEVEEFARILVRVNITMEERLLSATDAAAQKHGLTRSAFLAEAVRNVLRDERRA